MNDIKYVEEIISKAKRDGDYENNRYFKAIENTHDKTEKNMISSDYANRFIREFILERSSNGD